MKPRNISLIGMPGSGKSSIGNEAARCVGYMFFDSDACVEQRYGPITALFEQGEAVFRDAETAVIRQLSVMNPAVIATGGGSILRPENMSALKENGSIVYIDRPLEKILSDLQDETRPLLKGKTHMLAELYKERFALYELYADYTIRNVNTLLEAVEELVGYINGVKK